MRTDSFVIDTADTNITVKGIDLNNEEVALRILPAPKNSTLLSLRSPIDIGGNLKHPNITIKKGPLATRGIIATGLAALAPLAAVVAFVDPRMEKDSDCTALINRMNARTGKTLQTNNISKNEYPDEASQ